MSRITLNEEQRTAIQRLELDLLLELDRICRKYDIKYTLAYGTLIGAVRHQGFIPWDDDIDVCIHRTDYEKLKKVCEKELDSRYFYQTNETDPEYYHLFDKIRVNNTVFMESFLKKYHIHHGVYIDIFPLDYIPDSFMKRKIQYYRFHFYRTGLMSKYMMISARNGKKKYAARILKVLYAPFSLKRLYDGACRTAAKYKNEPETYIHSFCSPYKTKDIFQKSIFEEYTEVPFEGEMLYIVKNYDTVLRGIYGNYMELPPEGQRITRHDLAELKLE